MEGNQAVLDIGSRAHLCGTAHEDTHLAGTDLGEQLPLFHVSVGVVDKCDLLRGHTALNELLAHILVNGKGGFFFFIQGDGILQRPDFRAVQITGRSLCRPLRGCGPWGGNITEHKLGQFVRLTLTPEFQDIGHALIHFGPRLVRQQRIEDALVQSQLAAIRGDLEHIVLLRPDRTVVYLGGPRRERLDHFLLYLRGLGCNRVVLHLRGGEIELVGGLDVRDLLEQIHQLREVEELGKARPRPVAGALRSQLQRSHGFSEPACPAVEVSHAQLLQPVMLQIPLDGVKLGHAVGDGSAGGKHHAAITGQLIHVAALGIHIRGFLRVRRGEASHIPHFRVEEQVFVVVRLIHEHPVHTQLLKGDNIILTALGLQLFQPLLQALFGALQTFHGEVLAAAVLYLLDACGDLLDLLPQQLLLPLHADGDALKLGVSDDDGIIIAGGDSGTELLAVMGFKVFLGGDKDIGGGVQPQELRRPLVGQMIRHHENGLAAQPQALALHGCGHHLKGLARAHFVSQQGIPAVQHMGDSVFLMLPQSDFRVHAGEHDMAAVILPGTGAVHFLVVLPNQRFAALRVFPNPVFESVLDKLLLLCRQGGFLCVQDAALMAVCVLNGVIDADIPEVQGVLQQPVGVGPVGAVGGVGGNIVAPGHGFSGHLPFGGVGGIVDLNLIPQIYRGLESLVHELLDIHLIQPCRAQAYLDLAGLQVLGLCGSQRGYVLVKEMVLFRRSLRGAEFLPHVAGEVFVSGLPALVPMLTAVLPIEGTGPGVLVDDAVQVLHDLRYLLAAAHERRHEAQVHMSLFADADGQGLAGSVHSFNTALLLDGAFGEHIRFVLQLAVIVQHLQ